MTGDNNPTKMEMFVIGLIVLVLGCANSAVAKTGILQEMKKFMQTGSARKLGPTL